MAEQALSERIRRTWRLRAVDDDLREALGRRVLIAGKDLRNFGMELKHVDAGPLDLNDRQFEVLRRSRSDTPPFVFQFAAPPRHPWCFRIWALREDSLAAIGEHPYVTVTEREAEAFTMALVMGQSFTTTDVSPSRFQRTTKPNRYAGACLECGAQVRKEAGLLLRPVDGSNWAVVHRSCDGRSLSSVEITLDDGEPAFYLARFSDELVPDHEWPPVVPPRDYSDPPLRPPFVLTAARYLDAAGVFDRAPGRVVRRPDLTVVRQRTSATEIAERVLRRIREAKQVDHADVEQAVRRIEAKTQDRILRSPWVDNESIRRLERYARRLRTSGRPGPFVGSDFHWSGGPHHADDDEDDPRFWDWDEIRRWEAAARAKGAKLPKCDRCGEPLWLGQPQRHFTCQD